MGGCGGNSSELDLGDGGKLGGGGGGACVIVVI